MKIDYNKKDFSSDEKRKILMETEKLKLEHPNHIPLLVQIDSKIISMEKYKYLFSEDLNANSCVTILTKKLLNLHPSDTLVMNIVNLNGNLSIPFESSSKLLKDLYNKYKDPETNMLIIKINRLTTYKWVKGLVSYYLGY